MLEQKIEYLTFGIELNHLMCVHKMVYYPKILERIITLFYEVFPDFHCLSYRNFVEHPEETFSYISEITGANIADSTLFRTKLNGLVNRFLWANPIKLRVAGKVCRLFIDLTSTVHIKRSVGPQDLDRELIPLAEIQGHLPKVAERFESGLTLSVLDVDFHQLTSQEREIFLDATKLLGQLEPVLEAYDTAFEKHYLYYRQCYAQSLPDIVRSHFQGIMKEELRFLRTLKNKQGLRFEPASDFF